MKADVEVRQCGLDIIDLIEDLERRIFKPSEVYTRGFLEWLCENCSNSSYVAVKDGVYVGYIITCIDRPGQGHVVSLGVLAEYRRMGVGRLLMCSSICRLRGIVDSIVLEVRVSNEAAINLYRSLGFRIHHTIPGYYSDGESAYFMILDSEYLNQAYLKCQCGSGQG